MPTNVSHDCNAVLPTSGVLPRARMGPHAWAAQWRVQAECAGACIVPVVEVPGVKPTRWALVPQWWDLAKKVSRDQLTDPEPAPGGKPGNRLQCDATIDFNALPSATAVVFLFITGPLRAQNLQIERPFKLNLLSQLVMTSLASLPPLPLTNSVTFSEKQMRDAVVRTVSHQGIQPLSPGLLTRANAGVADG